MESGKFYIKKCSDLNIEGSVFMFYGIENIDRKTKTVKIGQVKAILIDRIIFERIYEFITDSPEAILNCFEEIPFEEARKRIDNTEALLSKDIFRR